jgi:membrane protein implicated in regulation of membrane protease activity
MVWLNSVYIGCTLFSVSITVLDFLGFLSGSQDGGEDIADGHDAGDVQGSEVEHGNMNFDSDFPPDDAHTGQTAPADITHPTGRVAVLSVLSYLRSLVYFCLGFGPTGWVAIAMGNSAGQSLIWAAPAGAAAFVLAHMFFRFQRTDTDSSLHSEELFFQQATVTVPLTHDTMGKVRVQVGMNVTEQYALAAEPNARFGKGDTVRVTNVTAECVYVEHENMAKE